MERVFSLGDLLAEEALRLTLVTGGPDALARRVSGAHAVELEHPARWLAPDWVMLTTGVALKRNPEAQRTLIRELQAANVSALGFGVDLVFKRIPPALLDEAQRLSFPVFEAPLETQFRELISTVHRSLAGGEMRTYQRLSSIQRYLVDALTDEDPQQTLLDRLAGLLDATCVLFGIDGTPLAVTGDVPHEALWREISASQDALIVDFRAGRWHAVAAPVRRTDEPAPRWLAVCTRRPGFSMRLAKGAVQAAMALLAAVARLDEIAERKERAARSDVLDQMLSAGDGRSLGGLALQAASLGVDFSDSAYVVVLEPRVEGAGGSLQVVAGRLEAALIQARVPHLVSERGCGVVALVQQPRGHVRETLSKVLSVSPELVAGVGRVAPDLGSVSLSFRDAQLVISCLRRGPSDGNPIADVAELDLATLLVSEVPAERLQSKVEEYLGPLRATRDLHQTLLAYFANDLDTTATARVLHIHPNTLRYRLARVEQIIGHSLRQPATIAALHIVLSSQASDLPADPSEAPAHRAAALLA